MTYQDFQDLTTEKMIQISSTGGDASKTKRLNFEDPEKWRKERRGGKLKKYNIHYRCPSLSLIP
jgi:hypothetical protein